ncbi:hypothetical protein DAETH_46120 (plasmid) [Deinococcus aetherius]|uniref:Uncharacterized protein n=1 Tax=Deinococcus aetherius TaxID=200252 RepID=A0ABN6RP55_9DEIO|nr:hypothetical protein [Deinococcus aetherius]BDP44643.1 hypothetical protein DAETH_46120 [Deinococcus aetherius]
MYLPAAGKRQAPWGVQEGALIEDATDFVLPSPSGLTRLPFPVKLAHDQALAELVQRPT